MGLTAAQKEHLADLAKRLIEAMRRVGVTAQRAIKEGIASNPSSAGNVFAFMQNTMVGPAPEALRLSRILEHNHLELSRLLDEPFIAEVLAIDDAGEERRFYFSRSSPVSVDGLDGRLASYRSPFGKLAEVPEGESTEIQRPDRSTASYTVLERARIKPANTAHGWDGHDARVETKALAVHIESLLEFLSQADIPAPEATDFLGALLAELEESKAVQQGIRRSIINRMSLRDQAILDRYQGEIFRLPVNRRVMLTGPPGTGKTTTLIRRLAQKRSAEDVFESEGALVPADRMSEFFHPDNWLMFAPTDLLKLYLKEAFACEGIAASDERVRTWSEERRRLAREVFRILRSERGGRFTLSEETDGLRHCDSNSLMALADKFVSYFQRETMDQYRSVITGLLESDDNALVEVVRALQGRISTTATDFHQLFDLVEFHAPLRDRVDQLTEQTNATLRIAINRLVNRDHSLLEKLGQFINTLNVDEEEEDNEIETEAEEDAVPVRDIRLIAAEACRRAICAKAISVAERRVIAKTSRNARLLDWLGTGIPEDADLRSLGAKLIQLRGVRFLTNTYRNLIDRVPATYHRFKRAAMRDRLWYSTDAGTVIDRNRVAGAEVDVMLLLMLRNARRFLQRQGGRGLREDTRIATLETLKPQYVTQVLVDEAPDFSPVQLACMIELAHPTFRSYFACGDVNQRATRWGLRTLTELEWISPDFEVKEIAVGYRQSRRLATLAAALDGLSSGKPSSIRIPDYADDADVWPLLVEGLADHQVAQWLSQRIAEIERVLGTVPSIAIVVDGDDKIDPLISHLRPLLAIQNLEVFGCKQGQMIGLESQIRVFDVQYIKGLEFEAVFFLGVDRLLASHPDLFENYLRVGMTRAATYLGLTSEGPLPSSLEPLRPHLSNAGWS